MGKIAQMLQCSIMGINVWKCDLVPEGGCSFDAGIVSEINLPNYWLPKKVTPVPSFTKVC